MIDKHIHNGVDSDRIKAQNLTGLFKTVSVVPTAVPRNFIDQIQIYVNGSDILLYVYDTTNATWQVFNYYEAP